MTHFSCNSRNFPTCKSPYESMWNNRVLSTFFHWNHLQLASVNIHSHYQSVKSVTPSSSVSDSQSQTLSLRLSLTRASDRLTHVSDPSWPFLTWSWPCSTAIALRPVQLLSISRHHLRVTWLKSSHAGTTPLRQWNGRKCSWSDDGLPVYAWCCELWHTDPGIDLMTEDFHSFLAIWPSSSQSIGRKKSFGQSVFVAADSWLRGVWFMEVNDDGAVCLVPPPKRFFVRTLKPNINTSSCSGIVTEFNWQSGYTDSRESYPGRYRLLHANT